MTTPVASPPPPAPPPVPALRARLPLLWPALLLFGYTAWFRVDGISTTFMLLADQIRDWTFALGPASDLPLAGAPSLAGGRSLGPVYYWVLWVSRVTIGPFVDYLPHAGGIGLSLLQSAADTALFVALARRLSSVPLAAAAILLIATSPLEAAVTASIWNPQVAVAFSKFTMALVLTDAAPASRLRQLAIVAVAWLAVQAHITAIFLAVSVFAWVTLRHLLRRRAADAAWAAYEIGAVVAILQVPYFLHHILYGAGRGGGPDRAAGALGGLLAPGLAPMLGDSARALVTFAGGSLIEPWRSPWLWLVPAAAALVVVMRTRRHGSRWLCVTVFPLLLAVVVWAPFRDRSDYWYLALSPLVASMVALGLGTWSTPPGWRRWIGWAALAAIVIAQPARFEYSRKLGRLPEYGTLVSGARQIARSGQHPQSISTWVPLPGTDPEFLVRILGGTLDPASPVRAEILANGRVRYSATGPGATGSDPR